MRRRYQIQVYVASIVVLAAAGAVRPAAAQLWKHLIPVSHSEPVPQRDFTLTQDDGPWLILVESFLGEDAEERARALAEELRDKGLRAYIHDRQFDFAEQGEGRGIDQYGAPVRRRLQREHDHQFAVLVGDFATIDDPEGQETLERIKVMPSKVLERDQDESGFDQVRQFSGRVMGKLGGKQARGPMGQAFLTRNPLLPREYFVPKGVDEFVVKMNKGVEYSLLDCPGRYTVQVATFRGRTILQTGDEKSDAAGFRLWGKEKTDPLVEAAEDAHLLTEELRAHGWEAYEFHDRTESIVTIGSFDQVAQQHADGRVVPTPQVQKIIATFGAAYDTPSDPLERIGDDPNTKRRVEEMKQQFNQALTSRQSGQVALGLNPKHAKIMRGKRVHRVIPFDVYPHTIEVPRRSISSAYAR